MDYLVREPRSAGNESDEFAVVEWRDLKAFEQGERPVLKVVDRRKTEVEAQELAEELNNAAISGPGV
jgi:hypothetical protein